MMLTENLPPEYSQAELDLLAQVVEANRAEFTNRCAQSLRANVFSNRLELRPRELMMIAEQETTSIINFLHGCFTCATQRGEELSLAGLGIKTVFSLYRTQRFFFMNILENNYAALSITSLYRMQVIEAYQEAREKKVLKEQENIRTAYEIALKHGNNRTMDALSLAQKATETSYRRVILAQEDERRRISRELHDEAGQAMVGIRMSLANLSSKPAGSPEFQESLNKTISLTENAAQQIRSLAYSLRPPMLDLLGLNLAIKQMCLDFSDQTGLIINYKGKEIPNLSNELSISIYRIVQEALTNTIKHARAKHVWIKLWLIHDVIGLTIKDDGQGIDIETIQQGIGLESMRERTRLLEGKMEIKSRVGKSTLFSFSFPITI